MTGKTWSVSRQDLSFHCSVKSINGYVKSLKTKLAAWQYFRQQKSNLQGALQLYFSDSEN